MNTAAAIGDTAGDEAGIATPAALERTMGELRHAQTRLASRSTILSVLDDVVSEWLDPDSPWRQRAERLLPDATGFSPAMLRAALPTMLEPLRAPALAALVATEAAGRRGPAVIMHILPGNLPGLAAIPTALSLAIGSAVLLKAGRGDRVFPALFAASIAERDADLGACVAACYWPGGDQGCEAIALRNADLVIASGDDATISDLARRTPGRFIGHGHRLSFAVVAREIVNTVDAASGVATTLAEDVALWDQRGCLSPQLCFVEGDFAAARRFAEMVGAALRPLAERWPPARLSTAERLAVRRFRDTAEWRALGGRGGSLVAQPDEAQGTVVADPDVSFDGTPLCRSLRVIAVADFALLQPLLAAARAHLESAGVAASPARWDAIAAALQAAGVHRVCRFGEMQRPRLDWHQGGRPRLSDWFDRDR